MHNVSFIYAFYFYHSQSSFCASGHRSETGYKNTSSIKEIRVQRTVILMWRAPSRIASWEPRLTPAPTQHLFFCPQIDDDNLSKLEKADILELTVNHLTKLHSPKDPVLEAKKFQAGFGQCAAEACQFIMSVPDLDTKVSQNLISHLSGLITSQPLTIQVPERPTFSPPRLHPQSSPTAIITTVITTGHHQMRRTRSIPANRLQNGGIQEQADCHIKPRRCPVCSRLSTNCLPCTAMPLNTWMERQHIGAVHTSIESPQKLKMWYYKK